MDITCPKCKGRMRVPTPETPSHATTQALSESSSSIIEESMPGPSKAATTAPPGSKKARPSQGRAVKSAEKPATPSKLFENDDFELLLTAGTLPRSEKSGPNAAINKGTPGIEKLANTSKEISDRDLFAIDLDSPVPQVVAQASPAIASEPHVALPLPNSFPWVWVAVSWALFLGAGFGIGFLMFKKA
ncbi:hypothetical protein KIH39_11075 [Telmatocola sphagniphila]|uniref:Uncharacterized protein n=1 Tax=Telmatocola sphagniphila TaxID=1123043 RepID=A0A8E6F049_9BACT|nr:hypothetical protein [Telmatocola sphagniphila]QVL34418.1 hypothetical protein KIH39_11075 [Telmatocola sphagniphila]